ncbi:SDR family NAD(P)-dependent oxidoreductase [Actinomadura sp. ATCC 39365]
MGRDGGCGADEGRECGRSVSLWPGEDEGGGLGVGDGYADQVVADLDLVRRVFETNFFGVIAVTDAMLPLLSRSAAARVVNVSSGVGSLAYMTDPDHYMSRLAGHAAYPRSKTALNSLTVQYAKDLRERGILVTRTADDGAAIGFAWRGEAGFQTIQQPPKLRVVALMTCDVAGLHRSNRQRSATGLDRLRADIPLDSTGGSTP